MPKHADLECAVEEFQLAESIYRQKLANLMAAAKAIVAAKSQDGLPQDISTKVASQ
jgi:hypothetical protein